MPLSTRWLARVNASVIARLYGSWITLKWWFGPPTSRAAATSSASERYPGAPGSSRYPLHVAVP